MPTRHSSAVWKGVLKSGSGQVSVGKGIFEGAYSFASRFEDGTGTNPEELIAAAHAACYSMAFSNGLAKAGHKPERLSTTVEVEFVPGTGITTSTISVRGRVPGIGAEEFQKLAGEAKHGCPVSKALQGNVELRLNATLE